MKCSALAALAAAAVAVTTVVAGLGISTPTTASAQVEAPAPRVVSPAAGAVLDEPLTEVTVDVTGVEPGRYFLLFLGGTGPCGKFACPGNTWFDVPAGAGLVEIALDEDVAYEGDHTLVIGDEPYMPGPDDPSSSFSIDGDVAYDDVALEPPTFSPSVRDGVRDTATLSFGATGLASRPTVVVLGDGESLERRGALRGGAADGFSFTWDGRDDNGDLVFPQPYEIVVDAVDADGVVTRFRRGVTVEDVPAAGRSRVAGGRPVGMGRAGRCRTRSGDDTGTARITCRGGTATLTYRLPIPAGAQVERFWVRGTDSGPADGDGRVVRRLERVGERSAVVSVRATGDVTALIEDVNVRWSRAER